MSRRVYVVPSAVIVRTRRIRSDRRFSPELVAFIRRECAARHWTAELFGMRLELADDLADSIMHGECEFSARLAYRLARAFGRSIETLYKLQTSGGMS